APRSCRMGLAPYGHCVVWALRRTGAARFGPCAVAVARLSWEYEIDFSPIFLGGRAFSRPVGRVVVEIGHVRRPEAREVAVEQVALHRLTESGRSTARVRLPARREHERAAKRDVWTRRRRERPALERHHVLLCGLRDMTGLLVDRR